MCLAATDHYMIKHLDLPGASALPPLGFYIQRKTRWEQTIQQQHINQQNNIVQWLISNKKPKPHAGRATRKVCDCVFIVSVPSATSELTSTFLVFCLSSCKQASKQIRNPKCTEQLTSQSVPIKYLAIISRASVEWPTSSKDSVASLPPCSIRTSSPPGCWRINMKL